MAFKRSGVRSSLSPPEKPRTYGENGMAAEWLYHFFVLKLRKLYTGGQGSAAAVFFGQFTVSRGAPAAVPFPSAGISYETAWPYGLITKALVFFCLLKNADHIQIFCFPAPFQRSSTVCLLVEQLSRRINSPIKLNTNCNNLFSLDLSGT